MNVYWPLVLAVAVGLSLGVFFYGGLYVTVTHGLTSQRPALWFLSSLLLRMSLVLTGFYFISDGDWQRLLFCLFGFVVTGFVFRIWIKPPMQSIPEAKNKTNATSYTTQRVAPYANLCEKKGTRHEP